MSGYISVKDDVVSSTHVGTITINGQTWFVVGERKEGRPVIPIAFDAIEQQDFMQSNDLTYADVGCRVFVDDVEIESTYSANELTGEVYAFVEPLHSGFFRKLTGTVREQFKSQRIRELFEQRFPADRPDMASDDPPPPDLLDTQKYWTAAIRDTDLELEAWAENQLRSTIETEDQTILDNDTDLEPQ